MHTGEVTEESLKDVKVGEKIGQGAYAQVFKGFVPDRGHFITIKVFEVQQEETSLLTKISTSSLISP